MADPRWKSPVVPGELYRSFFDDARLSDVSIKFGTSSVKAHKLVLARSSEYFFRMFCGSFAEANKQEVELFGDSELGVRSMLCYLYNIDILNADLSKHVKDDIHWTLERHAHVYVTAEKYGVEGLAKQVVALMEEYLLQTSAPKPFNLNEALRVICSNTSSEDDALMKDTPEFGPAFCSDLAQLADDGYFEYNIMKMPLYTKQRHAFCRAVLLVEENTGEVDEELVKMGKELQQWRPK
ncbi:hypothetical protein Q7P37_003568 [Cladosporium fusiforme]